MVKLHARPTNNAEQFCRQCEHFTEFFNWFV